MALRISVAAASRISSDACSLYQAVCGVQIRLGASLRGPWEKLEEEMLRSFLSDDKVHKNTTSEEAPEWLGLMNIQSCSSYPAFLQGLSQSFLIHQTAACRVDQERTLTHLNTQTEEKYKEKEHLGDNDDFNLKTSHTHKKKTEIIISNKCE